MSQNAGKTKANGDVPGQVFAGVATVPTGLVAYFATTLLLASPGNLLALVCLVLAGLMVGHTIRRYGIRSLPGLLALAAVTAGVLLALVLHRAARA